jgi:hypothetical protein
MFNFLYDVVVVVAAICGVISVFVLMCLVAVWVSQ